MKAFVRALSAIGIIWLGIYVLLCFIYMTFNITRMDVAHDPVWRGWFIIPSAIFFFIFLAVATESPDTPSVFIQRKGKQLHNNVISSINETMKKMEEDTTRDYRLLVLHRPLLNQYTITVVARDLDEEYE